MGENPGGDHPHAQVQVARVENRAVVVVDGVHLENQERVVHGAHLAVGAHLENQEKDPAHLAVGAHPHMGNQERDRNQNQARVVRRRRGQVGLFMPCLSNILTLLYRVSNLLPKSFL